MEVIINWWAILLVTVLSVIIGMFWYGPLFGQIWMKEMGMSMPAEGESPNMIKPMLGSMVGGFLMAYVLHHSVVFGNAFFGMSGWLAGLMAGFWYWMGFMVPAYLNIVFWENKTWKLFAINAGYWLAYLLLAGVIIASWIS